MSDTLEKTKTRPYRTDEGDHERLAHYVHKLEMERALMEGIPATALCGKKILANRDPERFPVCPECREILDHHWPEA